MIPPLSQIYAMDHPDITVSNSFLASGDFCFLLITFENSLDLDQVQQNGGPVLDLNHLTL